MGADNAAGKPQQGFELAAGDFALRDHRSASMMTDVLKDLVMFGLQVHIS